MYSIVFTYFSDVAAVQYTQRDVLSFIIYVVLSNIDVFCTECFY